VLDPGLPVKADKFCGVFAGLVQGFVFCTMFLVFIYGWKLPLNGLYVRSDIGVFICKVWSRTAVLPELHSVLHANPLTLI
jgi:hypothetical protein